MQLLSSGAHKHREKHAGPGQIIEAIERLKNAAINAFAFSMVPLSERILNSAKKRVVQPFQTVESYVMWSRFYPGQGYKEYPPETKGFFATSSPSIQETPWKGLVQMRRKPYDDPRPSGSLRNKLMYGAYTAPAGPYKNAKVIAEIGYPEEVQLYKDPYKYISWVLLGTKYMQPRNFLWVTLEDYQQDFRKEVSNKLRDAFDNFGRRYQASTLQLQEWVDRDFTAIVEIIRLGQNFPSPGLNQIGERNRFSRNSRLGVGDRKEIRRRTRRLKRNLNDLKERNFFGKKFDGNIDRYIRNRIDDLFSGRIKPNPRRFGQPRSKRR